MSREKLPIIPQAGLAIKELMVGVSDGAQITVRCYHASDARDLPVLVYIHGGGYVTGGLETDDSMCRAIAASTQILVLSIEYRLAPEYPFPVGFTDCYDVVRWVAADASKQMPVDLSRGFLLGGTSAGANFTAGISHILRDKAMQYPLTGVIFLAGSFCHPDARPEQYRDRILSVDEINDAPGLTRKSIDYFAAKYGAPPSDKRLSPLLFSSHARIAQKAFFAVCGWDPRRDEALLFASLLKEAGLATELQVYAGLPHGFWTTCPSLPVSRKFEADLIAGVSWLIS